MAIKIVNLIHADIAKSVAEVCPIKNNIARTAIVIIDVDDAVAEQVRRLDGVISVTNDMQAETCSIRQTPEDYNWGPPRIANTGGNFLTYTYNKTGVGVDIYIFDFGVNPYHDEVQANADYDNPALENIESLGFTFPYEGNVNGWRMATPTGSRVALLRVYDSIERHEDWIPQYLPIISDHGVTTSSNACGNKVGIATGARIISVCSDLSLSDFLICCDYIIAHHEIKVASSVNRPSVVNMSFAFTPSVGGWMDANDGDANRVIVKSHLDELCEAGIIVVAAAGNNSYLVPRDTVRFAPGGHHSIITVGGTAYDDTRFHIGGLGSNYGSGVDISAPAESLLCAEFVTSLGEFATLSITDLLIRDKSLYKSTSGTSLASPFVAGVVACVLELYDCPMFLGTAAERYDKVQEFKRFFLDTFYGDWTPTEGWPIDDEGSVNKIVFLNGSEQKMATEIKNLADLCRASTVGDYILTADIDAAITKGTGGDVAPAWQADTAYAVDEFVTNTTTTYRCIAPVANSGEGDFATQLAALKWIAAWTTALGWNGITWATTGSLNGDGHTISNLTSIKTAGVTGLFSGATNSTITNLKIVNCNIQSTAAFSGGAGAIAALATGCTIMNCHTSGAVASKTTYSGGLIGKMIGGNILRCSSSCGVTDSTGGTTSIGGLIGYVATTGCSISKSFSTGAITKYGTLYAGGLVGYVSSVVCSIMDCFATGNITSAGSTSGGLIGAYGHNVGTFTRCYATGKPTAVTLVGGLCGSDLASSAGVVFTNCFWDTTTSEIADGAGNYDGDSGDGKATADMKKKETFTGWDFKNTWIIPQEGLVADYPQLAWKYGSIGGSSSGGLMGGSDLMGGN